MANEYSDYDYVEAGTIEYSKLPPLDAETNRIMKAEFSTGFTLTLFYFVFIFSIPVMNWFAPEFAFSRFWGGMTVSWFITSIVAMAMAFIIAYIHTALYEKRLKNYTSTSQEGRKLG
ncbi:MAG: hypothetical protein ACI35R_14240 [Bacillus sp. (in: firmicutes)]